MVKEVYADCAASAPPLKCAYDAMTKWSYANPNSGHTVGRESRRALEDARETIARCINALPEEIAFTPSATAACRSAVQLLDLHYHSHYEHKAVIDAVWEQAFRGFVGPDTTAHILANNETGEIYYDKVKELSKKGTVFTDATAAVGQIPVNVKELGVAALAAGAHKFGGYPGIGFIYMKGGVSDDDTYPGTPPVALACAMADALKYRVEHIADSMQYLMEQTAALAMSIQNIPGAHINTPFRGRLPNILSVRFDGVNARGLLVALDALGVYASAGAACSADDDEPSRTLLASGLTKEQALSTIRLSFCPETEEKAFIYVAEALRRAVPQLRKLSR